MLIYNRTIFIIMHLTAMPHIICKKSLNYISYHLVYWWLNL